MTVSQPTTCRTCRAPIRFIPSQSTGTPIPVNEDLITVVTDEGQVVRGRVSHFATCSDASHHRRRTYGPESLDPDAIRAARPLGFEVVTAAGVPLSSHRSLAHASGERDRVTRTNALNLQIRWTSGAIVSGAEARVILEQEREEAGVQLDLAPAPPACPPDPVTDPKPNSPSDVGYE